MSKKKTMIIVIAIIAVVIAGITLYITSPWNNKGTEKTCTTYGNRFKEQCIEDYIGLTQQEAIDKAKRYKYVPKIVSIDGAEQPTNDIAGAIIHLEIKDGIVSGGYFEDDSRR